MISFLKFDPPVIAHRGASGYAPENTLLAFTKAAQLGIHWVEFDVMTSKDHVPIVFHDETLERTSDGSGMTEELTYAYLQTLDTGKWFSPIYSGERILTLRQVIDFLASVNMKANIEIKCSPEYETRTINAIMNVLSNELTQDPKTFLFSSFSVTALKQLRSISTAFPLGLLLHAWENNWQTNCEALHCVSVHVNEEIIDKAHAEEIKAMNKLLLCYTVNSVKRAKELYLLGADALFSDVPDKIAAIRS